MGTVFLYTKSRSMCIGTTWPKDANGQDPPPTQQQKPDAAIKKLERDLGGAWPSIIRNRDNRDFWRDQWNNHGRRGGLAPEAYFEQIIKFGKDSTRFKRYLRNAGINPDPEEMRSKVTISAKIAAGEGNPHDIDIITPTNLLYEIYIWLDTDLKYMPCPNSPHGDCIYPPLPITAAADDVATSSSSHLLN